MRTFFLRSLYFRIILLNLLTLTVVLSIFSLLLYTEYSKSLYEKIDALLLLKEQGIKSSLLTYYETGKPPIAADSEYLREIFLRKNSQEFEKVKDYFRVGKLSVEQELASMTVNIFDPEGDLVVSSNEVSDMRRLSGQDLTHAFSKSRTLGNRLVRLGGQKPLEARVLTAPLMENDKVKYIVQVVASLSGLKAELARFKQNVFMHVPLIVSVASLAAFFFVKSTLKPVNRMVSEIRQIRPNNLNRRILVPQADQEVARLAETFNQMLDDMERAFSSQQQIVQNISHELKTPLTVIKGEFDVALKNARTPAEYQAILESGLEEIEKIRRIVDDLLLLAHFDVAGFTMRIVPVNLNVLIQPLMEDMNALARAKNIEVLFHADENIVLKGNETNLKRLFTNLMENAIKYTPSGGRVALTLNRSDGTAAIEIRDNGIGIPKEDIPYIFDRFYRVDKARGGEGFGLGLSIVKSIVQAHKGVIDVQSGPGQGCTFSVKLPLSA